LNKKQPQQSFTLWHKVNMKIKQIVPFPVTMAVMLVLGWLAWKWTGNGVPVKSFFDGYVFTSKFIYVGAGAMDSFQSGVAKMFVVSIILAAVILPVITLCYVVTNLKTAFQEWVFFILSLALCIFPFSALGIVVVALARYILDMGVTAARVKGVACGVFGIVFIATFLFLLAKFMLQTHRKSCP
jgi:hypothetical protein